MTAADRPSVTDNARAEAVRIIDSSVPDDVPGYRIRYAEKAADALIERGLLAAGRAETTTANADHQAAVTENEHLRADLVRVNTEYHGLLSDVEAERDRLAARLAAVEALADEWESSSSRLTYLVAVYLHECADDLRAALSAAPTDTTKETDQ